MLKYCILGNENVFGSNEIQGIKAIRLNRGEGVS